MLKRLVTAFALLCASLAFAQTKSPLVQPMWQFGDASGAPCAGCSLYTYLAGTTTPTPTYTDSSGASMNQNPIVLNAAGLAQIWVSPTVALKLILKDTSGNTVWTADNILGLGGSGGPCGPASTIQIANSTVTGFSCDPLITINPLSHTINVGGTLPTTHFSLTNLASITASWTFDVTSPTTAALSVGGGTAAAGKYIDGGTGAWTTLPSPGAGTVTSVGITVPSGLMTVSGSPVTGAGSIAIGLNPTGTGTKEVTSATSPTSGYGCWSGTGDLVSSSTPCVATNDEYFTFTGCLVGGSTDNQCSGSFNLPVAMPDSSYQVFTQANVIGTSGVPNVFLTINQSTLPATPSVAINYVLTCTFGCSSTVTPSIYVHAHHN